jgi:NAD(P)H-hydrate repair Nnr-like enzyme with NAD(P)H-hydrate epimerase domain
MRFNAMCLAQYGGIAIEVYREMEIAALVDAHIAEVEREQIAVLAGEGQGGGDVLQVWVNRLIST